MVESLIWLYKIWKERQSMNPAFAILVILGCIAVWFLASALYKPIGRFIHRIGKDAIDELTEEDKEEKENS